MAITSELIGEIFKGLENVDGATLFNQVADDIETTQAALERAGVRVAGQVFRTKTR